MKYINSTLFVVLTTIYLLFSSHVKFSTNFLEVFFSKESMELFNVAKKLGYSNQILIAKKGFNQKSLDELYTIATELKKIDGITHVDISLIPSKKLRKYLASHYFLLSDFNNSKIKDDELLKRLQNIYNNIITSPIYEPLNTYDPLSLFSSPIALEDRYLKLKDFGYVLKAQTNRDTSDAKEARILYNKINEVVTKYSDTIAFSPFFYLVENSTYIKSDAQKIMTLATILLLILYFFILKNYRLFFNTLFVIGSSILSAILLSSELFGSINILALVFGISITTVSIDYMFHYYFHNDFTHKKFIFQKRVFLGFLTTFGVFLIFSFIDVKLFAQLAFFSAVSLSVAYVLFSSLFIYLEIKPLDIKESKQKTKGFNPLYIIILSLGMLGYSYFHLSFDTNMRNLDYKNIKLLNLSKQFQEGLQVSQYQAVIISAKSRELLLQRYEKAFNNYPSMLGIGKYILSEKECKKRILALNTYDFFTLKKSLDRDAKQVGFHNAFTKSYSGLKDLKCDMDTTQDMKFKIIQHNENYYTMAYIKKTTKIIDTQNIQLVDLSKSLAKDTKKIQNSLTKYMLISFIFILIVLFVVSKFELLYPLSYLLFPLSSVLFAISLLGQINVMHMFALIILVAIGIDYGIYMHKTTTLVATRKSIQYALLSTFAGFGVLIFSNTMSLYSIGFVITIGIGAIFILIYLNSWRKKI